jgi:hypothetical protein
VIRVTIAIRHVQRPKALPGAADDGFTAPEGNGTTPAEVRATLQMLRPTQSPRATWDRRRSSERPGTPFHPYLKSYV